MLEEGDVVVGFEVRLRRLDGRKIWVRVTARQIETTAGSAYEGSLVDVTGRRSMEDELWERAAQQEAAATIGQMALESEDIDAVVGEITKLVSRVLGTEGVVLFQRYANGDFGLAGATGDYDMDPNIVSGLADRTHMTTEATILGTGEEVKAASPGLWEMGVRACAAVMVPGSATDFGTLMVFAADERPFSTDDINFLVSVTNVISAAIDRSISKERLEELLRSKDAFVASVSHELRTPLTVVTGMAHELNERWANLSEEELEEFTAMLVEQSRDMSDLIEDLLVAARSSVGNVAVRKERVAIGHEIERVLAGFPDTGSSSIVVRGETADVSADPIRVRQILRNLTTNALRYGGTNIEITWLVSRNPSDSA
jgi:K+-sensing histidine kinase KdpD